MIAQRPRNDDVEGIAAEIRGERDRIAEMEREIARAHHRIGQLALAIQRRPGCTMRSLAAAVGISRDWLARHAQACAAMLRDGQDDFEAFVTTPTRTGGVLSASAYLDYGAQRTGEARRAWRARVFGVDIRVNAQRVSQTRMREPGAFDVTDVTVGDGPNRST